MSTGPEWSQAQAPADQAAERFAAVADVVRALGAAAHDDEHLPHAIAAQVAGATGEACIVRILADGADCDQSAAVAVHGVDEHLAADLRLLASQHAERGPFGLWERVSRDQRIVSIAIEGAGAAPDWTPAEAVFARRWSVVAIALAPLLARERLLGAIALIQRATLPRLEGDDELLRSLATCSALMLANARFARAARHERARRSAVEGTLNRIERQIQILQEELIDLREQMFVREDRLQMQLQRLAPVERRPSSGAEELVHRLTARERQVLRLLADGLSNKEIGRELGLSAGTARNHVSHLLTKLEVADRVGAAVKAVEAGIVHGPDEVGSPVARRDAGRRRARSD
jgi:DNA-binding CsgD family transcriptional regulator